MIKTLCLASLLALAPFTTVKAESNTSKEAKVEAEVPKTGTESHLQNIQRGNVAVGGSFGMGYSSYSGSVFYLNPTAEYFVFDRFSVGGTLQLTASNNYTRSGIGPSFSYYFWQNEKWAALIGAGALYQSVRSDDSNNGVESTQYWTAHGKLGLDYFIYPSVAFGPHLTFEKSLSGESSNATNTDTYGTLLFQLSVLL